MDQQAKNLILKNIDALERLDLRYVKPDDRITKQHADLLEGVLRPLLAEEGYRSSTFLGPTVYGPDFIAQGLSDGQRPPIQMSIRHLQVDPKAPLDIDHLYSGLAAHGELRVQRILLVSTSTFTDAHRDDARRIDPGALELLDVPALRAWVGRIHAASDIDELQIKQIFKAVNNRLARLIVEDPDRQLEELEWRDLERLVADMFDGMGFDVKLTPGSKDGGKDVILTCTLDSKKRSYIVEIKHWRSRERVLSDDVKHFLNVLVREKRDGGLFLSTYGYANNAFESLTEVQRETLRFGDKEKIVGICRTYLKIQSGIWSPKTSFRDMIFDGTI